MNPTERMARSLGYELRRNQVTKLWHWQIIDSTVLDWRGTGYATKESALRAFALNAKDAAGITS